MCCYTVSVISESCKVINVTGIKINLSLNVVHFLLQNIPLPDCFFSFFDLRKEFKKHSPAAADLKDLDLKFMADCIL